MTIRAATLVATLLIQIVLSMSLVKGNTRAGSHFDITHAAAVAVTVRCIRGRFLLNTLKIAHVAAIAILLIPRLRM